MHLISNRSLLLLLSLSSLVVAMNISHCLEDFRKDPNGVGGVDARGRPTNATKAVGLTYKACLAHCGPAPGDFTWDVFTQLFSSWFLPWLALISELPFHSGSYRDDFISVIMSVGSPALAAYSLILTSLNVRLVYRRARRTMHESSYDVARALISLQQTPLELTRDERLLAFIPVNDQWKREIINRHNRSNALSIATGTSIAWAVITLLFALVDSTVFLSTFNSATESIAVGTLWLWLLCLVIGWLWVPTFTIGELKSTLRLTNLKAAERAAMSIRKARKATSKAINSAKTRINDRFPRRVRSRRELNRRAVGPALQTVERLEGGSSQESNCALSNANDHRLSAISLQISPESQQGSSHLSIRVNPTINRDAANVAHSTIGHSVAYSSIHPETDRLLIPKEDLGSLHRDEFRPSATFNYARVMRYLVLVDDVWRALDRLTREKDERKRSPPESTSESTATYGGLPASLPTNNVVFPPGALTSMFIASIFAFILQFGVTTAAAIILIFTPRIGLGCYSLGYILYGVLSLVIFFLTIVSTILVRISETRDKRSIVVKRFTAFIAIAFRRTSLFLAFLNAAGLVLFIVLQFMRFLNSCYCYASVSGTGVDSYALSTFEGWISVMRTSRILATILAAASMATYMIFLRIMSAFPSEIDLV